MELETELRLSYYRTIGTVDARHGVSLVQHTETGRVYVEKAQKIYDLRVYRYLQEHPAEGVPRIEELIEGDGTLYVVEEYIPGETLRERLDREGPMDEAQAAALLRQLCRILSPLHRLDPPIVHRDIKPGNLIVRDDGRLVLVDFNTAKESHAEQERDTVLIGTAGYAAPEQYGFSASRPTADVYAMGVLYHELLTGRLPGREPFPGRPGQIIRRCLCMEPSQRYRTAEELLAALSEEPPQPRPEKRRRKPEASGDWKSWLPPGFRKGNPLYMAAACFWYWLAWWATVHLEIEGHANDSFYTTGCRLITGVMCLALTLWVGNYRGVWDRMPLTSSRNWLVRALGAALWAATLSAAFLLFGSILMELLTFLL